MHCRYEPRKMVSKPPFSHLRIQKLVDYFVGSWRPCTSLPTTIGITNFKLRLVEVVKLRSILVLNNSLFWQKAKFLIS